VILLSSLRLVLGNDEPLIEIRGKSPRNYDLNTTRLLDIRGRTRPHTLQLKAESRERCSVYFKDIHTGTVDSKVDFPWSVVGLVWIL